MNTIPNEIYCNIYSHITSISDIMQIFTLNTQSRNIALDCVEYIDAPNQNIPFSIVNRLNNLKDVNANIVVQNFEQIYSLLNKRYLVNLNLLYLDGDTTIVQSLIVLFSNYCDLFTKIKNFTLSDQQQLFFRLFEQRNIKGYTLNISINFPTNSSLTDNLYLSINRCLPISNIIINDSWQTNIIQHLSELSTLTLSSDNFLALPRVQRRDFLATLLLNVYHIPNISIFQLDKYLSYDDMHTISTSLAPTLHYLHTHLPLTLNSKTIHFHFPLTFSSDITAISSIFPNLASLVLIADNDIRLSSFIPLLPSSLQFLILILNKPMIQSTLRQYHSIVNDIRLIKL